MSAEGPKNPAAKGSTAPSRQRADVLVVQQGLAATRSRAQALILAGAVLRQDNSRVDKAGATLSSDTILKLKGQPLPYVSRGGLKLARALQVFSAQGGLQVAQAVCLDVGASTGGFTDCLLQHGASRVYALDVGYNQLAWSVRQDPRVVVLERLNIRHATEAHVPEAVDLVVIDVSFISLRTVLPTVVPFARPGAHLVALVKPQFEVGRARLGKSGVVRDASARADAVAAIVAEAAALGLTDVAVIDSPIVGAKGNHEFLLHGLFSASR